MDYSFIFSDTKENIENILNKVYADFIEIELEKLLGTYNNE